MTIRVVRVRTRETIMKPGVGALIMRAVEATRYPGTTPDAFARECLNRVGEDALGIFVGFEDDEPRALAVAMLPSSCMMLAPQVALVYSRGKPPLIRAVGERLKAWLMAAGYDGFLGVNLWRDDAVFMRGFGWIGEPRRLGSLIEWKF